MIPVLFDYRRASSVPEAVELLGACGEDAKLLAGGHSLLPLMKLRLAAPGALIDIGRLRDLSYIREDGDRVAIGALTRYRDVEISEVLRRHVPLLAHATSKVGDPQVRHRGTIGGSIAHGDPASDVPAVCLALRARFTAVRPRRDPPDRRGRLLPGLLGNGARTRRGADGDLRAEGRRLGLVVPEVQPPGSGLGHCRGGGSAIGQRQRPGGGADQYGADATASPRR